MANPSTEGGTGAGTEVARRFFHVSGSSTSRTVLTLAANHIYTLLSMQVTNHSGSATNVMDIYIDPEGTTEKAFLAKQITLAPATTFVLNDRVVMVGSDDSLIVESNSSCELKIYGSYIDQTFS